MIWHSLPIMGSQFVPEEGEVTSEEKCIYEYMDVLPLHFPDRKLVQVQSLIGTEYEFLLLDAVPKACFSNIGRGVFSIQDAMYVLGFGFACVPIEHAWIKIGYKYYDPTWEAHTEKATTYISAIELYPSEVARVGETSGYYPDVCELARLGMLKKKERSKI